MARRLFTIGGVAALFAIAATGASASVPEGPRLAFTRWSLRPEAFEILSTNPVGGSAQSIVRGNVKQLPLLIPFGAPAWSPDGSLLAFTGLVGLAKRRDNTPTMVRIFLIGEDGSGLHAVPGTNGGYEPIFSPNGQMLAFSRARQRMRRKRHGGRKVVYESASAWLADLASGSVRQLTPWRNHLVNVASSFSPDGSILAVSRRAGHNAPASIALHLDGSGSTVLTKDGFAPQYSPDGSQIALLRGRRRVFRERRRRGKTIVVRTISVRVPDLFVMRSDGSGLRRLTRTPNLAESAVSWDPSGQRIAYTLTDVGNENAFLSFGETIVEANADGTCPTPILTDPEFIFFRPVWQPGPGRGASRIPC